MCIPHSYDSKASGKTCKNTYPFCVISVLLQQSSNKLVKGHGVRLEFIRQIKWQTDKVRNIGELLAMIHA